MHNHEIYFFLTLPNEQCRETFHPSALSNKGKQNCEPGMVERGEGGGQKVNLAGIESGRDQLRGDCDRAERVQN